VQLATLAVADFDVERGRRIPVWIIVVSVVVGLLLLTLVIIVLCKVHTLCLPSLLCIYCLCCFDTVGWTSGRPLAGVKLGDPTGSQIQHFLFEIHYLTIEIRHLFAGIHHSAQFIFEYFYLCVMFC